MSVTKVTIERGSGDFPTENDKVKVAYTCYLKDDEKPGDYFKGRQIVLPGQSGDLTFRIGNKEVVPGMPTSITRLSIVLKIVFSLEFEEGVSRMKLDERCILTIPSERAYGEKGFPGYIPPNAALVCEIRLWQIDKSPATVYSCTYCRNPFDAKDDWSRHEFAHLDKDDNIGERWRCPEPNEAGGDCAKKLRSMHLFEQHRRDEHGMADTPRECCVENFTGWTSVSYF
ncbi:Peptidyl-prolyl cis-trans isomerase fkbp14 [Microsporum ferrugineum]